LVVQAVTAVTPGDTAQSLAMRVHQLEHRIYPLAMRWFAEGRLQLDGDSAMLDGVPLPACGTLIRA
jgi:phosphoribosylglycinamide formyltransferase-1